jgi:hypothetical protein
MARLVAVTIKKNGKIVKSRLFAAYFGIIFLSFEYNGADILWDGFPLISDSVCWFLASGPESLNAEP